jgi:hypothetical protein
MPGVLCSSFLRVDREEYKQIIYDEIRHALAFLVERMKALGIGFEEAKNEVLFNVAKGCRVM